MQNMSFHVLDKICKFCGVVVAVAKTRHSRELYIWERKRVRVLSARGLVHCFFTCSQGKNPCYGSHEALYWWHTWRRLHDFWWLGSAKLTFVNLVLEKTTSLQNVVVHGQPTKSFPSALHVADNYTCELWPSRQTRTPLRSRSRI